MLTNTSWTRSGRFGTTEKHACSCHWLHAHDVIAQGKLQNYPECNRTTQSAAAFWPDRAALVLFTHRVLSHMSMQLHAFVLACKLCNLSEHLLAVELSAKCYLEH